MSKTINVGQSLPMTIEYLDQNGIPMSVQPTPDSAPQWSNSNSVADTLTQTPFLHFVDMHYQTDGRLGTKARNGPNFYT